MKKHTLKRKGISLLISWVLLVGFVVALAVFVTMWSRQQAEKNIGEVIEMIEGDARCNDVSLNAEIKCINGEVKLINRGYFTIYKLVIRIYKIDGDVDTDNKDNLNIEPGDQQPPYSYNPPGEFEKIEKLEIVPVIKIDEKFVGCSDRKAVVEC